MFTKKLAIDPRTADRWQKTYKKTGQVPYKTSKMSSNPKSSITTKHEEYMERLLDQNPQLFAEVIIKDLTKKLDDFSISKVRLNHCLKNNKQINTRKLTFEAEIRNSVNNLNIGLEWFMKWKDTNLDSTKNCVLTDATGF